LHFLIEQQVRLSTSAERPSRRRTVQHVPAQVRVIVSSWLR
jgi:hypothetical protein